MLPPITLVLGGARSGKSRYAESLVESQAGTCVYLATATAGDAEMAARIERHRVQRGGRWATIEAPLDLAKMLEIHATVGTAVLVDCLTLWLSNLMGAGRDLAKEREVLVSALLRLSGAVVLVANEVGHGIVPDNALARQFRDAAGELHQAVAATAQAVVFMVAGQPLYVKTPE